MSNALQEQALDTVFRRYNHRIMNNIQRGDYVECLVAALLGPKWTLPWTTGYDWAPWDLEHDSEFKIEVRQSAARQPWHTDEDFEARPPRFDIAPRKGYFTRNNEWVPQPGRPAGIYIFAWHPKTKKELVDHRAPEQWTFYVIATEKLPKCQRGIGLSGIESRGARKVRSDCLATAVEQLLSANSKDARIER